LVLEFTPTHTFFPKNQTLIKKIGLLVLVLQREQPLKRELEALDASN